MNQLPKIIRVFEHQTLRVGEAVNGILFEQKHFLALVDYASGKKERYFTIRHHAVRFTHYVGVIQIGNLLIEILPKTDRYGGKRDFFLWQRFLLDLLRAVSWLKVDYPGLALIDQERNNLLNYIIDHFLKEVERLLKKGLTYDYRSHRGNLKVLKGRLIFREHLQKNQIHQERFFTEHQVYEADHLPNQVLFKTLQVLAKLTIDQDLQWRIHRLSLLFPPCTDLPFVTEELFVRLMQDRGYTSYQNAFLLSRMILLNYRPGIKGGKYPLLGMLFDMNQLWEQYIYGQLAKVKMAGVSVSRQSRRPFWDKRYLQADLVLTTPEEHFILDTKWKVLSSSDPSMEDLRQMFVYAQFFDAPQAVLIYPQAATEEDRGPISYALNETKPAVSCRLCFVKPIKEGRLNLHLGEELLASLIHV